MPASRSRPARGRRALLVRAAAVALAVPAALAVQAQEVSEEGRTYYLQPSVTFRQTLTDNGRLQGDRGRADLITEVRPSVRFGVRNRWARASVGYSLIGIAYARDSDRNDVQQTLSLGTGASGSGELELIENRLFLEGSAGISQRVVSPFGLTPTDPQRSGENTAQVGTYTLAPYLVGSFGGAADYRLGVSHSGRTQADKFRLGATSTSAQANLSSGRDFGRLRWGLAANRTRDDFEGGRRTDRASVVGTLSYVVGADLVLNANAGADWNNFSTVGQQRYDRYGAGFQWRPSERTLLAVQVEDRYFGTGYDVIAQYRTPRTVWTLSGSRDATDFRGRGTTIVGTAFDLLYAQFASIQPDPLLREQLVLEFLRTNGIPPETLLLSDFLFQSATLQQRHQLSFALVGRRSTLTVAATQSRISRIDNLVSIVDVFDDTRFVRQRGLSVTASHRLTPLSSLSLRLAEQRSDGELDTQSTRLRTVFVTWSTDLGRRTTFALEGRHAEFDSLTRPYTENSLVATLNLRFY